MKSISDISLETLAALAEQAADEAVERASGAGIAVTGLRDLESGIREIVRIYPDGTEERVKLLLPDDKVSVPQAGLRFGVA